MGFFGFIGNIFKGLFDFVKAVFNTLKNIVTGNGQTTVTYQPKNPIYTYNEQNTQPQQYHRDELRWENDPTDPENPNNANAQEMRRLQPVNYYASQYQARIPYTNNGNIYSYGYMNQMNPVSNTAYMQSAYQSTPWSYPQTPYNVQVQTGNQYSNQELRWKESPEAQIQMYGRVIHPYDTTPTYNDFNTNSLYGRSYQPSYPITQNQNNWNWNSNMTKSYNEIKPLKDETADGVVCAFGRRSVM